MKKKVICVDCDGILADFIYGFTQQAHQLYDDVPVITTMEQPKWDGFPNMTQWQIDKTWEKVEGSDTFWSSLPMMLHPIEVEGLHSLTMTHNVYFTTARRGHSALEQTRCWLQRQVGINHPNVIITRKKGLIAAAVEAEYLIDDKAGNAVYAEYHCKPKLKSYLLNRPYNKFAAEVIGSGVKRIKHFNTFLEDIWVAK